MLVVSSSEVQTPEISESSSSHYHVRYLRYAIPVLGLGVNYGSRASRAPRQNACITAIEVRVSACVTRTEVH
jgi:hypothetical protein